MAKINILDSSVFNYISAGEVVERPASVVKELVENSIDAGASDITIKIVGGGIKNITILDNGCGIEKDDIKKAFLPHATSKIASRQDIDSISTLGFRGEALASISAVSKITLKSKTENSDCASELNLSGGELVEEIKPCAYSFGTSIAIGDLFFNTPARAKFLKKPKQEEAEITSVVEQIIFSNPNVAIKYEVEGKILLQSFGDGLDGAILSVYKSQIFSQLIRVSSEKNLIKVTGFTSKTSFTKPTKGYQTIIVNGRVIKNATISTAVTQAYGNTLMRRNFPIYVLNILIPFEQIDVNVHPSKTEVRFLYPQKVFSAVYSAINEAILSKAEVFGFSPNDISGTKITENSSVNEFFNSINSEALNKNIVLPHSVGGKIKSSIFKSAPENNATFKTFDEKDKIANVDKTTLSSIKSKFSDNYGNDYGFFGHKKEDERIEGEIYYENEFEKSQVDYFCEESVPFLIGDEDEVGITEKKETNLPKQTNFFSSLTGTNIHINIMGQIFNTYLIVEAGDECYLFDQHACHEKILYDKFIEEINSNKVSQQFLLLPFILEIDKKDYDFISSNIENLKKIGFEIDEFAYNTFKINAIPSLLSNLNLDMFFADLIKARGALIKVSDGILDKLAQSACKAAIKAGDKLTNNEIEYFLTKFLVKDIPLQCPHGRPAIIKFTKKDIDKLFKRIL